MLKVAVDRVDASFGSNFRHGVPAALAAPWIARRLNIARAALAGVLLASGRLQRAVTLPVRGPDGDLPFTVPDLAAFRVLGEMLHAQEYAVDLAREPRSILDLGAHIGASALFFRRRYANARIVAVEANPSLVRLLRKNTRGLGVEVRHAAVASGGGVARFSQAAESWAGSTVADGGAAVEVPAIALDDLLTEGFDFVKIDVEGAEFEVLRSSRRLREVHTIVGEIHGSAGDPRPAELIEKLREHFAITTREPHRGTEFTLFAGTSLRRR